SSRLCREGGDMRLDKRVKDLFRYVGLRSQSLADPTLRYRAPLGAKSRTEYDPSVGTSHCR
ncbi:MAG: hypothetical protein ACK49R_09030, partial [Planctomycetota bacterium]